MKPATSKTAAAPPPPAAKTSAPKSAPSTPKPLVSPAPKLTAEHIDAVLDAHATKPHTHHAHTRHQAHPHHRLATIFLVAATALLLIILVTTLRQPPSQKFTPPTTPLNQSAATTQANIAPDLEQLNPNNLSDSQLAP